MAAFVVALAQRSENASCTGQPSRTAFPRDRGPSSWLARARGLVASLADYRGWPSGCGEAVPAGDQAGIHPPALVDLGLDGALWRRKAATSDRGCQPGGTGRRVTSAAQSRSWRVTRAPSAFLRSCHRPEPVELLRPRVYVSSSGSPGHRGCRADLVSRPQARASDSVATFEAAVRWGSCIWCRPAPSAIASDKAWPARISPPVWLPVGPRRRCR
jgi:hypothetical protein